MDVGHGPHDAHGIHDGVCVCNLGAWHLVQGGVEGSSRAGSGVGARAAALALVTDSRASVFTKLSIPLGLVLLGLSSLTLRIYYAW